MMKRVAFFLAIIVASICIHADEMGDGLYKAILKRDVSAVEKVLKTGASANSFGSDSKFVGTPLIIAITSNSIDTVRVLLDAGANPNLGDRGWYPVDAAVDSDTRILKLLLARGANPNTKTPPASGESALGASTRCRNSRKGPVSVQRFGEYPDCEEALKVLLAAGAKVNEPGLYGNPALSVAVGSNRKDLAIILIGAGADIDQKNLLRKTPLNIAIDSYALEQAGKIGIGQRNGESFLPMIEMLLGHGADPNLTDGGKYDKYEDSKTISYSYGYTMLGVAARHGWIKVTKLLLEHGADPTVPRSDGRLPADIANDNGHRQVELLIRASAVKSH